MPEIIFNPEKMNPSRRGMLYIDTCAFLPGLNSFTEEDFHTVKDKCFFSECLQNEVFQLVQESPSGKTRKKRVSPSSSKSNPSSSGQNNSDDSEDGAKSEEK